MKRVSVMYCSVLLAGFFLAAQPAPLHSAARAEQKSDQDQRNGQSDEQHKRSEKTNKEDLIRRYEQIRRNEEAKRFDEAIRRSKKAGKHEEVRKYEEAKRKWELKNGMKTPENAEERTYAKTTRQDSPAADPSFGASRRPAR